MTEHVSLDGRTLVGVDTADSGVVSDATTFEFEPEHGRVYATYAGGAIVEGHLIGTVDDGHWDVRYVQLDDEGETATGHSRGEIEVLDDGRVRVEDDWEWESRTGGGESVLEEIE
jgi:hypothetical protein